MFDWKCLDAAELHRLTRDYHRQGFVLLNNVEEISALFPPVLAEATGLSIEEVQRMIDPKTHGTLSPALRQQLSKVTTTPALASALLRLVSPLLLQILGPIVHVSSNFHAQLKGGGIGQIGYSGFHAKTEYVEIHGPHLLHQDFSAASLPISPGMVTLWVALNTTASWTLRLYPGSHQQGVLCDEFLEPSNERLSALQEGVDIQAHYGQAVLFNGMMLHGTGIRGEGRRASCDIRFFPLCGFLPSEPHLIHREPLHFLQQRLSNETLSTVQAPLLQDLVFLGKTKEAAYQVSRFTDVERFSHLHWIQYLVRLLDGEQQQGFPFLRALVNNKCGLNDEDILVRKFKDHPIYPDTLRIVRNKLAEAGASSGDLQPVDDLITSVQEKH